MENNNGNNRFENKSEVKSVRTGRRPRIGSRPSGEGSFSSRAYVNRQGSVNGNRYSSQDEKSYGRDNNNGYRRNNSSSYSNNNRQRGGYANSRYDEGYGNTEYRNNNQRRYNNQNRRSYGNHGDVDFNNEHSFNSNNDYINEQGYSESYVARKNYNRDNNGGNGGYQNRQRRDYNQTQNSARRFDNRTNNYQRRGNNKPNNKQYDPNAKYSKKKQIEYANQFVDYTVPMRLNKFLANSGLCSRREADEFISAGVVTVNGNVVTELGTKIIPATDKVMFHDQTVKTEKKVYILLNKPKDCVTTSEDTHARLTVLDLIKNACSERVYPVGRLDRNTTGVLLITNDGDLTSKLTHPKYEKKKIYQVTLDKELTPDDMEKIRTGITLEDGDIKADDISYVKEEDKRTVGIEIHSGKNRIVRRIFDHLGYHVVKLDRVYFAGLTKKNLPRGKWRFLSEKEVNMLKMTAASML